MAWLTSIKGAHPSLIQSDKTLEAGSGLLVRGSIMAVEDGRFVPATTDGAGASGLLYIALQEYRDAQAGMAGKAGFEPGGAPFVSGISMSMPGEYETSLFDFSDGAPGIGEGLAARNGVLVKASSPADTVAILTSPAQERWVNNAPAKTVGQVVRQGTKLQVIRYRPVRASGAAPEPVLGPLCFTAQEDGSTVKLLGEDDGGVKGDYKISYDGTTWEDYTKGTEISLDTGDKVYFAARTTNAEVCWYDEDEELGTEQGFTMSGKIAASGNVMSLYGDGVDAVPISGLSALFYGCTSLTGAPELSATTLAEGCYSQMFSGCTSLTEAPALPVTTLAVGCYFQMFYGCTSLTEAPALPATTLAESCYSQIFSGCTSLTGAPALPATTLAKNCYRNMFDDCTSLTVTPDLPAITLAGGCYEGMFYSATNVTEVHMPASMASVYSSGIHGEFKPGLTPTFDL